MNIAFIKSISKFIYSKRLIIDAKYLYPVFNIKHSRNIMSLFNKNHHKLIFLIFLAIFSNNALAVGYSKSQLQQLAINYLAQNLNELTNGTRELSAQPIDPRISDKSCNTELLINSANVQRSNRQSTIQIKCLDEKKWNLYVQVKIMELAPIVVVNQNLNKGEVITRDHLITKQTQKHLIRTQYLNEKQMYTLLGSRSKRNIRSGSAITYKQVCMVCKGDRVTIFASYRGLRIKTAGIALQDGIIGQNISVKNSKSGKKLHAKVLGVDQVKVSI